MSHHYGGYGGSSSSGSSRSYGGYSSSSSSSRSYGGSSSSTSSHSYGGSTGSSSSSHSYDGYTGHSSSPSYPTHTTPPSIDPGRQGGYTGRTGGDSGSSSSGRTSGRNGGYTGGSRTSDYGNFNGGGSHTYTRRQDPYTTHADRTHIDQQTDILRRGGTYHRDLSYDTRVNRTTVIINNNRYYQPRYYSQPAHAYANRYNSWGGGFWAGYMAGSINQAAWDNYYSGWNAIAVGAAWAVPYATWQPYYTNVLATPLLYEEPIDYERAENWQHPPLNASQDPLEQLASFGQLTKPGFLWSHSAISAEEARARLNNGDEVDVAGVAVRSYDELARIVPEMAKGTAVQGASLPPQAQQAIQAAIKPAPTTATVNDLSVDDLINKLPAFAKVYSPRTLSAEEQVDGKNINRTMDAAEAVYNRPEVQSALAQWWKENPDADRDTLNRQINKVVTKALVDDLSANAAQYAADPTLSSNPVDYLKDPSSDASATAYNQQAIQTVLNNADAELRKNLITKTVATLGQ